MLFWLGQAGVLIALCVFLGLMTAGKCDAHSPSAARNAFGRHYSAEITRVRFTQSILVVGIHKQMHESASTLDSKMNDALLSAFNVQPNRNFMLAVSPDGLARYSLRSIWIVRIFLRLCFGRSAPQRGIVVGNPRRRSARINHAVIYLESLIPRAGIFPSDRFDLETQIGALYDIQGAPRDVNAFFGQASLRSRRDPQCSGESRDDDRGEGGKTIAVGVDKMPRTSRAGSDDERDTETGFVFFGLWIAYFLTALLYAVLEAWDEYVLTRKTTQKGERQE